MSIKAPLGVEHHALFAPFAFQITYKSIRTFRGLSPRCDRLLGQSSDARPDLERKWTRAVNARKIAGSIAAAIDH